MESVVWRKCLGYLQDELSAQQFNTWIRPLHPVASEESLRLLAPNVYVRDRVSEEFLSRIRALVDRVATGPLSVVLEVGSMAAEGLPLSAEEARVAPGMASRSAAPSAYDLNPDFTFESFVVGRSNEMAKAAAQQVAENAGQSTSFVRRGGAREDPPYAGRGESDPKE